MFQNDYLEKTCCRENNFCMKNLFARWRDIDAIKS